MHAITKVHSALAEYHSFKEFLKHFYSLLYVI